MLDKFHIFYNDLARLDKVPEETCCAKHHDYALTMEYIVVKPPESGKHYKRTECMIKLT